MTNAPREVTLPCSLRHIWKTNKLAFSRRPRASHELACIIQHTRDIRRGRLINAPKILVVKPKRDNLGDMDVDGSTYSIKTNRTEAAVACKYADGQG
jgi:hypothetical protein